MAIGMTYSGSFGPTYSWSGGGASASPRAASAGFGGFASSIGGALSISGAVSSVIGSYYSAAAAKSAAKFQAKSAALAQTAARSAMQHQGTVASSYAQHMVAMQQMGQTSSKLAIKQGELTHSQTILAMQHQMEMQKLSLGHEASIAESNARMSELQAQSALLQGERQEQSVRLATAGLKSRQRVSMAANGIDLGSDSAVNTLTTTDVLGEIDAITVQTNAARAAWGHRAEATNFSNQALFARAGASTLDPTAAEDLAGPAPIDPNVIAADYSSMYAAYRTPALPSAQKFSASAISPIGSAFSTLLGAASSVAGQFYSYSKAR